MAGPRQAPMGEQHRLGEARLAAGRHRIDRDAGERREARQQVRLKRQRHQRGPRLGDAQAELRGRCRSRSPSRPSWGSTCRRRRPPGTRTAPRRSTARARSRRRFSRCARRWSTGAAPRRCPCMPGHQHVDDLARGAVAEQLAEGLLVIGDAVALDQRDEIRLRVAAQRRDAEARIARDEVLRRWRGGW